MAKTCEIMYQAAGARTGLDVQIDVYKPDKSKDATQSGLAQEVGTTGRYYKNFVADAPGWFAEIADSRGGKAVVLFDQAAYDGNGIGQAVADVQTAVDAVNAAIGTLNGAIDGLGSVVDAVGGNVSTILAGVALIQTTLATIQTSIDDLEAPPMVG